MSVEAIEETAVESEAVEETQEEIIEGEDDAATEDGESDGDSVQADTEEELEQEIEAAVEDGATEEEVIKMVEEFQLKVNGKTVTKTLDWNDKDSIKVELQKAAAGQLSMQELADLKKLVKSEFGRLQTDPWAVLEELGLNPDELAEQRVRQKVEQLKKDPDTLEKEKLQKEIADLRKKEQDREEKEKEQKAQQSYEEAAAELQEELLEVLENDPELDNTPKTVSKIADAMLWAENNGYKDVKVIDVLPAVKEELQREMNRFFDDKPLDFLEKFVGKKTMEKLRLDRIKAAKKTQQAKVKETTKTVVEEKPKDKMRAKDFFKTL